MAQDWEGRMTLLRQIANFYGLSTQTSDTREAGGTTAGRGPATGRYFVSPVLIPLSPGPSAPTPLSATGPPLLAAHSGVAPPFELRAASIAGSAHQHRGAPREDCFAVRPVSEGLVAAVADGLGDERATLAWLGAKVACDVALDMLEASWSRTASLPASLDLDGLSAQMTNIATRVLGRSPTAVSLSTTLVCTAIAADGRFTVLSIGDSVALVLRAGGWSVVGGELKGLVVNDVDDALPNARGPLRVLEGRLAENEVLMLASDGLADAVTDHRTAETFARWWAHPPVLEEFLAQMSFVKRGESDDRTGVCIWYSTVGN